MTSLGVLNSTSGMPPKSQRSYSMPVMRNLYGMSSLTVSRTHVGLMLKFMPVAVMCHKFRNQLLQPFVLVPNDLGREMH
jgi:hypothetical protein